MCEQGWKGDDCSQIDCAYRVTAVDALAPRRGGVYPGQVIGVVGRNLDCNVTLECEWKDRYNGAVLMRTPARIVNEFGGECVVPEALSSSVYHPSRYADSPSSALLSPLSERVPPLARIILAVSNTSATNGPSALTEGEFALMRCQPPSRAALQAATRYSAVVPGSRAWTPSLFDFEAWPEGGLPGGAFAASPLRGSMCENGGTCTVGGTCVCPPGWAGPLCGERALEALPPTCAVPPAAGSGFTAYGSDVGSQALHPALAQFQAVVEGDWVGPTGSDTEGLLLAGRDATIGAYSVGERWTTGPHPRWEVRDAEGRTLSTRADLAVGRFLTYTSGAVLSGGNVVYGSNASDVRRPMASAVAPGAFVVADDDAFPFPGGADMDGAALAMRWLSASLARLPRTGTTIHKYARVMTLTGTRPDVNVFHLSSRELAEVDEIELVLTALPRSGPKATGALVPSVVINVLHERAWSSHGPGAGDSLAAAFDPVGLAPATNVTFADLGLTGDFNYDLSVAARVIWNLPKATALHISRIEVIGTVLAPHADVDFPTGEMHGQMLASSFRGNGQINLPLWTSATDPALVALIQATDAGVFHSANTSTISVNGTCAHGSCGAADGNEGATSGPAGGNWTATIDPFGNTNAAEDVLAPWRSDASPCVPQATLIMMEELVRDPASVLGWYGAPVLPSCAPFGFLNENGTCTCWDPATYKGRECEIQCRDDFCNGRGVCDAQDQSKCVCFDPVRWEGDRCERSTCGVNKRLIDGPTPDAPKVCVCAPGLAEDASGACTVEIDCVYGTVVGEKCQCTPGWSGDRCDVAFPEPIRCYHGRITESTVQVVVPSGPTAGDVVGVTVHNCSCFDGWTGAQCDVFAGRGSDSCYFGVLSTSQSTGQSYCKCDPLWAGPKCDIYTCLHGVAEQVLVASDGSSQPPSTEVVPETVVTEGGAVESTEANAGADTLQCRCLDGWFGADCGTHCRQACNWRGTVCDASGAPPANVTSVTATAGTPAVCTCDEGFTGSQCEQSIFALPSGAATVPPETVLSSSNNVTFFNGVSDPGADQATARLLAATGQLRLRGLASSSVSTGRALQQASLGTYEVTIEQSAGQWIAGRVRVLSGASGELSEAIGLAGSSSVVGGGASHRGTPDELVAVIPLMVRIQRPAGAAVQPTTVSVVLPASIKDGMAGTHQYAAIASSSSSSSSTAGSSCTSGALPSAVPSDGSAGADAQYDRTTGAVRAIVCEAGMYHIQIMQPSLVNRAFPAPGIALPDPSVGPSPQPLPGGLPAWAIALIAVGSVLLVGALALVAIARMRRSGRAMRVTAPVPRARSARAGLESATPQLAAAGSDGKGWGSSPLDEHRGPSSTTEGDAEDIYADPREKRRAMRAARRSAHRRSVEERRRLSASPKDSAERREDSIASIDKPPSPEQAVASNFD